MQGHQLPTRRDLLTGVGVGVAGTVFAGTGSASRSDSPDGHIVGTTTERGALAALRRASGGQRVLDFGDIGFAVAGQFPDTALDALRARADVRYVEEDAVAEALGETLPWGIDRVEADVVHSNGDDGSGADIAIVDTGIDSDHPDLDTNLGTGKAIVSCDPGYTDCNKSWDDDNGHGTHCAGIADAVDNTEGVIGVCTAGTLHAVKVLDEYGSGSYSDVAEGLQWVADQGYDVASLSLGGETDSQTLHDACQYAQDNGVLVVAAAGNDGDCTDCVLYPAKYSEVVAVSATDSNDDLAYYSSTGPEIELAAPGSDIYSTDLDGYDTKSGTSMACPHVSGGGGQLMADGYSNSDARSRLKKTAEDIGLGDNEQGSGLLDVEAALSGGDTSVAVSTGSASSVGETSATLNGSLDDLGGASSADCYFEWRESGASSWNTTSAQTLSSTGSYSESISGLTSGTDYEFRAVADASDGDSDTGGTNTFTTNSSDTSVAVTTDSATGVDTDDVTLNGSLDDLGGASSAECYFAWRESGASSWNTTSAQTLSSTGSYSESISGLSSGTDYEFRAVADASDGDSDTGGTVSFTTDTTFAVSTDSASSVGETSATLNGTLDDLGGASSADCTFKLRQSGVSSWSTTSTKTLSSTGSYSVDVSGLESDTEYEFCADATASDGDTDTGSTLTFTTDASSNSAPAIDSYVVTEAGSPNPHCEITADWDVSDTDGNLASVDVDVYDSSGSRVKSASHSVSGSSANGTDEFKIKHARNETFDVVLTVTDGGGKSASQTQSVTE